MVELNGLETVLVIEENFDNLIGLCKSKKFMFGGDLNRKHTVWNSRLISSRGRKIVRHEDRNHHVISAPYRPTYYPSQQKADSDVLDIFLHHIVADVVALDEQNSHHVPVFFTARCSMTTRLRPDECHVRWDMFR